MLRHLFLHLSVMKSLLYKFFKCTDQFEASTSPTGNWLSSLPRGGEFEPCMAGVESLNRLLSGLHVSYLLVWRCFKVMSTLSWANDSKEKVHKVQVLKLGKLLESPVPWFFLLQKIAHQFQHLGGAFKQNFSPVRKGGGTSKVQIRVEYPREWF